MVPNSVENNLRMRRLFKKFIKVVHTPPYEYLQIYILATLEKNQRNAFSSLDMGEGPMRDQIFI